MGQWDLEGARVIVTGGSRGIGRAVVEECVRLGADVLVCARTASDLEALGDALGVAWVAADVSAEAGRAEVVEAARARWGGLDVLVNNAGTNLRRPTLEYTLDDLRTLAAANLESAWGLCCGVHPLMVAAGGGAIVNLSSVAALQAVRPSTAAYAMTKGGMEAMTRFLAAEWGAMNIRVNTVAPWYTHTPLAEPVLRDPARRSAIVARTPLGRVAEAEEVAHAVAFLAMPASSFITGICLPVDGGFLALGA